MHDNMHDTMHYTLHDTMHDTVHDTMHNAQHTAPLMHSTMLGVSSHAPQGLPVSAMSWVKDTLLLVVNDDSATLRSACDVIAHTY